MNKVIEVAPWLVSGLSDALAHEKATGKESFFLKSYRKADRMLRELTKYPKPISRKEHPKPYAYYEKRLHDVGITVPNDFVIYHFEGVKLWRVPFSFTRNEVCEAILILDIVEYPAYKKIFGYKK